MGQLIVNVIFALIKSLSNIILSPIFALISTFIPSFSNLNSAFSSFVSTFWGNVAWCFKVFMIPSELLSLVLTVNIGFWTFLLGYNIYKLMLNLYNKLKI